MARFTNVHGWSKTQAGVAVTIRLDGWVPPLIAVDEKKVKSAVDLGAFVEVEFLETVVRKWFRADQNEKFKRNI